MKMTNINFKIPQNILSSLNLDAIEFTQQSRLYTALQLYKNHKLSYGKASELAGISKDEFLLEIEKHNINLINYEYTDLEAEIEMLSSDHGF